MNQGPEGRPVRLWVVVLMNVLDGLLSLFALAFLTMLSSIPEALRPDVISSLIAIALSGLLVISSILALLGKPRAGFLMLIIAVLFHGTLAVQNFLMLARPHELLGEGADTKLIANVVRSALEIAINCWALLSSKTREYFARQTPG
jgi:hypothetical protein